jgi:glycosyltransferase involved in cell wall biosynthesis
MRELAPELAALGSGAAVWLVMPAFNEAAVIARTVQDVRAVFANIVVVDDASADCTGAFAQAAGAHVCRHPINLGQGAALQTGIDYALTQGAEVIVSFDADGQHQVSDALALLRALERSGCDVALGSRFLGGAVGMSRARGALLRAATTYTRLTTGLAVTDTHNGLRAFRRTAAQRLRIRQNRMAHASEILARIAAERLTYVEVPCTIIYTDYSKAKGQSWSGAFSILSDLFLRKLYK